MNSLQKTAILDRIAIGKTPTDINITDTQHQLWVANKYLGSNSHINTNYACTVTVELDFGDSFTVRFLTYDEYDKFYEQINVERIKRVCALFGLQPFTVIGTDMQSIHAETKSLDRRLVTLLWDIKRGM